MKQFFYIAAHVDAKRTRYWSLSLTNDYKPLVWDTREGYEAGESLEETLELKKRPDY